MAPKYLRREISKSGEEIIENLEKRLEILEKKVAEMENLPKPISFEEYLLKKKTKIEKKEPKIEKSFEISSFEAYKDKCQKIEFESWKSGFEAYNKSNV